MPDLLFQYITLWADLLIFIFVGYYFWEFRTREKALKKKETKVDTEYHKIVDDALTKERKILEDATVEAEKIIADTSYISKATKETVDQALQKMVLDIQKEALATAQSFTQSYQASLNQIATSSLHDFQNVAKELEGDLQKQVKEFHETLLPNLQKELEGYKQSRLEQTDQTINKIIQKVSEEVLNISLPISEHQTLLIQSLEKAKKEGIFE